MLPRSDVNICTKPQSGLAKDVNIRLAKISYTPSRNFVILFMRIEVDVNSSVRKIFEKGAENLRLMKTRMKIFQPKTKSVFQPKIR